MLLLTALWHWFSLKWGWITFDCRTFDNEKSEIFLLVYRITPYSAQTSNCFWKTPSWNTHSYIVSQTQLHKLLSEKKNQYFFYFIYIHEEAIIIIFKILHLCLHKIICTYNKRRPGLLMQAKPCVKFVHIN